MALSPIEDSYLQRLTSSQFPDMPASEPAMPVDAAALDAPSMDGMQLAAGPSQTVSDAGAGRGSYAGFDPRLDMANKGQQDQMRAYDPTTRERIASFLQAGFEGLGMDRYKARQNAQTLIGGGSSNLPLDMGLADIVPFLGTALQTEEAVNMGGEAVQSAQQGNYGTAALQAGGAVLGLVPGAAGTVKAAKGLKNLPVGMSTQAVGGMDGVLTPAAKAAEKTNDVSYRSSHAAPSREFGATLDDLTGGGQIYPADIYSKQGPRIYGTGMPYDKKAFDIANKAKGNPDAEVTIYRAVPDEVTSAEINRGDWVAITQEYARDHGESVLRGEYKIITKKVKAKDIYTNGDSIQEWGYDPAQKGTK